MLFRCGTTRHSCIYASIKFHVWLLNLFDWLYESELFKPILKTLVVANEVVPWQYCLTINGVDYVLLAWHVCNENSLMDHELAIRRWITISIEGVYEY